jgi:hypothetical protein
VEKAVREVRKFHKLNLKWNWKNKMVREMMKALKYWIKVLILRTQAVILK